MKIEIEDNGRGMKAADLEALQQRLELHTWEIINGTRSRYWTKNEGY